MTATRPDRRLSRRQFLPAAAGVAAAGVGAVVGYEAHGSKASKPTSPPPTPAASSAPGAASGAARSFVTRPDLRPPSVKITTIADATSVPTTPRFFLLAPNSYLPGSAVAQGLMMLDRQGRLVWFAPVRTGKPFDLNIQSYKGRDVLTWWAGQVTGAHGEGAGQIADGSYRVIKAVRGGDGLVADLHDLVLTSAGTALMTAYETTRTDLSSVGGSRTGRTFVGHVLEIDLQTGKVLLDWNSLQHVGVPESYAAVPGKRGDAYDYFHINSVSEMDDGNLLVSARNTWGLYKIDRVTGAVLWRLNGKRSDFSLSGPARFYWQHDSRAYGDSMITVFDNAGPQKEKRSRGLLLSVDPTAKRVDLTQAYDHPAGFLVNTQGSIQRLPDGRVIVGWGDQPYFSEFAADGTLLLDGQLPFGVRSYRTYTADWVGRPADPPRVVAQANPAGGFVVYASWNGATEIANWVVMAGATRSALAQVGSQRWSGLETAIAVNSGGPYFQAVAVDAHGNELGRSEIA